MEADVKADAEDMPKNLKGVVACHTVLVEVGHLHTEEVQHHKEEQCHMEEHMVVDVDYMHRTPVEMNNLLAGHNLHEKELMMRRLLDLSVYRMSFLDLSKQNVPVQLVTV